MGEYEVKIDGAEIVSGDRVFEDRARFCIGSNGWCKECQVEFDAHDQDTFASHRHPRPNDTPNGIYTVTATTNGNNPYSPTRQPNRVERRAQKRTKK
jgi:hypothetical protein